MRCTAILILMSLQIVYTAHSQDKVFEMVDKDLSPREIQLLGTENSELLIHYIQHNIATGYDTKIHKSYLIVPGDIPRKISLPYSLDVKGLGYNNDSYFFIASHREGIVVIPDGKVTIFKLDKSGQSVSGMMDLNLEGENNKVIFSEGGFNYVITSIKKPSKIRIRRIKEFNIETFDFPMEKDQISFLTSKALYVPQAQTEITTTPVNLKVFMRNGKIMAASRDRDAVFNDPALNLYEFSLTSPPTYKSHPIVVPGSGGKLDFFPYEEKLLVFKTNSSSAKIDIVDVHTGKILKSFSTDEPNNPMLKGAPYKWGFLGMYTETRINDGEGNKLPMITKLRPWIHAWLVDAQHLKISFGNHIPNYQIVYLNIFLDPVSLDVSDSLPGAPTRREFLLEKISGERKPLRENLSFFYTKENPYILEFGNDRGAFTIWK